MNALRSGLPPLPARMANLPIDARGYPVPRFVHTVRGVPDHRVADTDYLVRAITHRLCWVCGEKLERDLPHTFVVGPVTVYTRVCPEPPMHDECARYATMGCPFLTRPHAQRRSSGLPAETHPPAGTMLTGNPGVTGLWQCRYWGLELHHQPRNMLAAMFMLDDPLELAWMYEGRVATGVEVGTALSASLMKLADVARSEDALQELEHTAEQMLRATVGVMRPMPA